MQTRLATVLAAALLAAACGQTDTGDAELRATLDVKPAFDPGSMTRPPALDQVTGSDAVSRAKAEEVYFRCSKVPRAERKDDPWCQLREKIF